MQQVARETSVAYERRLERAQVPAAQHPDYHRWIRFYLDFCYLQTVPSLTLKEAKSPLDLGPGLEGVGGGGSL